jgi:hypothetical protein
MVDALKLEVAYEESLDLIFRLFARLSASPQIGKTGLTKVGSLLLPSGGIGTDAPAFFQYLSPPSKLIEHCARHLLMPLRVAQVACCVEEFPGTRKTDRIANSNRMQLGEDLP